MSLTIYGKWNSVLSNDPISLLTSAYSKLGYISGKNEAFHLKLLQKLSITFLTVSYDLLSESNKLKWIAVNCRRLLSELGLYFGHNFHHSAQIIIILLQKLNNMFAQLCAKNRDIPNTLTPFFADCCFMNAFLQYYYASLGNKQYHIAYLHICGWSIMDLHKRIKGVPCRYLKGQLLRFVHILSWLRSKGPKTKKTQDSNNVVINIYIPESLQYIFFYFFVFPYSPA